MLIVMDGEICERPEPCEIILPLIKEEAKEEWEYVWLQEPVYSFSTVDNTVCKEEIKEEITVEEHLIDSGDINDTVAVTSEVFSANGMDLVGDEENTASIFILRSSCSFQDTSIILKTARAEILHMGHSAAKQDQSNHLSSSTIDSALFFDKNVNIRGHNNVKEHTPTHSREKLFSCQVCSAKFMWGSHLRQHSVTHTGEKLFSCQVCSAKFSQSGNLKRHSVTHTGEKLFSCRLCSAKFSQNGNLKRHSVTHTGEKLFSCRICSAKFSQSGNLKRHSLLHSGGKPFSCQMLPSYFSQSGTQKQQSYTF